MENTNKEETNVKNVKTKRSTSKYTTVKTYSRIIDKLNDIGLISTEEHKQLVKLRGTIKQRLFDTI